MATADQTSEESKKNSSNPKDVPRENPYFLPARMLFTGHYLYGARVFTCPVKDDEVTHTKNIRALRIREDDVFIVAYPKCGTHWTWEVTHMLLAQNAQYESRTKEHMMLEICYMSDLDAESSPRIFNTHLWMCHMPTDIVAKKSKIVHVMRNPKDTVVSFYHHLKQGIDKLTFDGFLKAYMRNDQLYCKHQFDFMRQISAFEKEHPDHPIIHLYFEDMKRDPLKVTKELAEFLQVPASDSFCEQVVAACSFDKMKAIDSKRDMPQHIMERFKANNIPRLSLYRKGVVGDWKNQFTVAQNEVFDDFIEKEIAKGMDFKIKYE